MSTRSIIMKRSNNGRRKPPFLFGKDMEQIKEAIKEYGTWGIFISIITLLIRPFISLKQTIRDVAITFIVSMLSGLCLEYFDCVEPVRYGVSGVCGLFAVRIYMIVEELLKNAEKNPVEFIKHLKGGEDDR